MNPRIDRTVEDWKNETIRSKFEAERFCRPSAYWVRTLDECDCCDHDLPESSYVQHHCILSEFDFGPRWTFVVMDHRHADKMSEDGKMHMGGMSHEVVMDAYKYGIYEASWSFKEMKKSVYGLNLSLMSLAENHILKTMGAPIMGWWREE